ncbi:MAG: sugar ABC transporter permease YjfF [Chloroflexi bacterium]|nr:sugar ABC transporter permease YjfF [Chloroflexota bacterium]
MMPKIRAFISRNQRFIPLGATATLAFIAYGVGAALYPGMRDLQVFLKIFRNNSYLLISAVGMTFVIISGGIDLSVSGVVALTTVAAAALLRAGWDAWTVILLMLLMGMALGAVMGSFITYMKVQPFIATLAGMWFARGMCFFISDDAIAIDNPIFRLIGQTKLLIPGLMEISVKRGLSAPYISIPVVVAFTVLLAAIFIAHFTRFGRTVYAIGGYNGANEQSARLMGLPVNRTKMLVYILSGFCSGLAGVMWSIFVMSGHGLYASGFEMDSIASVVMGGTMLTGGEGYVFGTLFGVLIFGITQTLIQFNGSLSSWWTRIVIGLLMFIFIGVQSLLASRKGGRRQAQETGAAAARAQRRRRLVLGGSAAAAVILAALLIFTLSPRNGLAAATAASSHCELQGYRQDQAAQFMPDGAIITYERNGGSGCIDELYVIYPDGRIVGDNGVRQIEKQASPEEINQLLAAIHEQGWFTDEMYSTWHTPCGQCYGYYLTVSYAGQEKTVKGVSGGTDAPANYWQVISLVKGIVPSFSTTQ